MASRVYKVSYKVTSDHCVVLINRDYCAQRECQSYRIALINRDQLQFPDRLVSMQRMSKTMKRPVKNNYSASTGKQIQSHDDLMLYFYNFNSYSIKQTQICNVKNQCNIKNHIHRYSCLIFFSFCRSSLKSVSLVTRIRLVK